MKTLDPQGKFHYLSLLCVFWLKYMGEPIPKIRSWNRWNWRWTVEQNRGKQSGVSLQLTLVKTHIYIPNLLPWSLLKSMSVPAFIQSACRMMMSSDLMKTPENSTILERMRIKKTKHIFVMLKKFCPYSSSDRIPVTCSPWVKVTECHAAITDKNL